jgi:hypothetical protein
MYLPGGILMIVVSVMIERMILVVTAPLMVIVVVPTGQATSKEVVNDGKMTVLVVPS